jgi:hypothetical protein
MRITLCIGMFCTIFDIILMYGEQICEMYGMIIWLTDVQLRHSSDIV